MPRSFLFTSESVSEGHPDKVADQVSDSVLDALLAQDPRSRVACETLVNTGMAVISGEITTNAVVDFPEVVRNTIKDIGYNSSEMGFDSQSCAVKLSSVSLRSHHCNGKHDVKPTLFVARCVNILIGCFKFSVDFFSFVSMQCG